MNLIESINTFRVLDGLSLLKEDKELNEQALKHAKFNARRNWISDYKIILPHLVAVGDNEDAVIRQIVNQPEPRKILFDNWIKIGTGAFRSKRNIIYWVILFS